MAAAEGFAPLEAERWRGMLELFRTSWDSPIVRTMMVEFLAPDASEVERNVMSEFLHVSGDGVAIAGFFQQMLFEIDTRDLTERVAVPTLVIHGQDDPAIPLAAGRELPREVVGRLASEPEQPPMFRFGIPAEAAGPFQLSLAVHVPLRQAGELIIDARRGEGTQRSSHRGCAFEELTSCIVVVAHSVLSFLPRQRNSWVNVFSGKLPRL